MIAVFTRKRILSDYSFRINQRQAKCSTATLRSAVGLRGEMHAMECPLLHCETRSSGVLLYLEQFLISRDFFLPHPFVWKKIQSRGKSCKAGRHPSEEFPISWRTFWEPKCRRNRSAGFPCPAKSSESRHGKYANRLAKISPRLKNLAKICQSPSCLSL